MTHRPRLKILVIAGAFVFALGGLIWWLNEKHGTQPVTPISAPSAADDPHDAPNVPLNSSRTASPNVSPSADVSPAPIASPSPFASPSASPAMPAPTPPTLLASPVPSQTGQTAPAAPSNMGTLVIPVAGARANQLQDTFTAARSEGRSHDAIDIIAPRGTPVLAVADGRIVKLFLSERGGITIYQLGADERTVYYYAHLERYADGLAEGRIARRGEVIAYVGDTGNAGAGNYHLHFSIALITDPRRYFSGTNINPYPILMQGETR